MRIIDKNTDFYDYLQNMYHDDSKTFDRTDSFILTKEMMCDYLYRSTLRWDNHNLYRFVLLQVCNTFWLFLFEITSFKEKSEIPANYRIELLATWKNYSKPRVLNKLDIVSFRYAVLKQIRTRKDWWKYDKSSIHKRTQDFVDAINNNDFDVVTSIDRYTIVCGGRKPDGSPTTKEKHLPLLIACGIGNCIEPLSIYLSFEEYFSLEATSQERTSSIGITDKEKIESHGFDTKASFRGK